MANLFFPSTPGLVNYVAWIAITLAMFVWLLYLRKEYGEAVVPLTSQQEVGETLRPMDVANQLRTQKGLDSITEQQFKDLQEKVLMQLRASEPPFSKWVGRMVECVKGVTTRNSGRAQAKKAKEAEKED